MNVNYYNSIFKAYNIKLFFSMSDWDDKKFVSTTIENNDGVTMLSLEQLSDFKKSTESTQIFYFMVRPFKKKIYLIIINFRKYLV